MLKWALIFAAIAVLAGVLGYTGIAAGAVGLSMVLFAAALVLFVTVVLLALLTSDAASLFEDRARALMSANRPADALRLVNEAQSFAHTHELFRLKRTLCRRYAELCRAQAAPTD